MKLGVFIDSYGDDLSYNKDMENLIKGGNEMLEKIKEAYGIPYLAAFVIILAVVLLSTITGVGQTNTVSQTESRTTVVQDEKPAALQPVFTEYKGVAIGMTADEVRDKIDNKPKLEDKDGFYYVFSDNEAMQIVLDENKKVKVISIIYSGENSNTPTYEAVFGKEVPLEPGTDGRVYNLVRYPQSGFWVAYSKGAGENPTVTVTIQKLWNAQ
jgi:hypothetical protein